MAISRLFVSAAILSVAAYAAVQPVSFKGLKSLHIDGCCGPMVVADFNHDGKPDVAVGGKHGLVVLLGDGKGNLKETGENLPVGAGLLGADFNGDGNLDLASIGASDQIEILLGNGDGTFHSAPASPAGPYNQFLVADFNGDGKPDLVAWDNGNSGQLWILLGNGDGTFQSALSAGTGFSNLLAVGDFNGDGIADLAAITEGGIDVLLGNGDGSFQPPAFTALSITFSLSFVQTIPADFNGDGKLDLAVTNTYYPSVTVWILLGNGDGTFTQGASLAPGGYTNMALGDFNGDHIPDLVVTSYINSRQAGISIFLGNGDGTFKPALTYLAGYNVRSLATADMNGDGILDVVAGSDGVSVMLGVAPAVLEQTPSYEVGKGPSALAVGDFNGDGKPDLAVANGDSRYISLLLSKGNGSFERQIKAPIGAHSGAIVVADVNGDGKADIVVAHNKGVSILLGNGDATFQPAITYPAKNPSSIAVGDVNGDGKPDLAISTYRRTVLRLGKGDGTFGKPVDLKLSGEQFANYTYLVDLNGDGKLDLVTSGCRGNHHCGISILLGNGDGSFQLQPFLQAGGGWPLAFGDIDGDGILDMVAGANPGFRIFTGLGNGKFKGSSIYSADTYNFLTGDFNGDGLIDVASTGQYVSLLLHEPNGAMAFQKYEYPVGYSLPSFAMAAADFNGDGKLDLAVADNESAKVFVLINTTR